MKFNLRTMFFFALHNTLEHHVILDITNGQPIVEFRCFNGHIQIALFHAGDYFSDEELTLIIHPQIVFFICLRNSDSKIC